MILTVTLNPCVDKTYEVYNFKAGALNRAISVRIDAAGKGINVSRFLKVLKCDTVATGFMAGNNGAFIKKQLDGVEGVSNRFVSVNGDVRVNSKIIDRKDNTLTELNEPSFTVDTTAQSKLKDIIKELGSGNIVIFSGSAPSGIDANSYASYIAFARECGAKVFFDADGDNLKQGIEQVPMFIKPNLFELSQFLGRELTDIPDIATQAAEINNKGIRYVLVSLGEDGAILSTKNIALYAPALKVDVKSTVGAGDALTAGFAFAFEKGYDDRTAFSYAVALASAKVETQGTQPPSYEKIMKNISRVKISEI